MKEKDLDYYNILYRIWSVMAFGSGTALLNKVNELYPDPADMYIALTSGNPEGNAPAEAVRSAADVSLSSAEKIYAHCEKKGISLVTPEDKDYPVRLKGIFCPPPVLFYRGDISGMNDRLSIGVVGARKPSEYSLKVTAGIVRALSAAGFDIISGFAEGVDICAQMTAVKSGGRTFGVLGAGVDIDYPKPNRKYRDYIEQSGALISEYLPGTPAHSVNFPKRNRILAGLSMSVAVMEAGAKSGSLNSASHCSEQGKTVFAVAPSDLFDTRYRGNVELIRLGAVTLMGAKDIFSEYCTNIAHTIDEGSVLIKKLELLKAETERLSAKTEKEQKAKVSISKKEDGGKRRAAAKKAELDVKPVLSENVDVKKPFVIEDAVDETGRRVLDAMISAGNALRADEIAQACEMDIGDVLMSLTELEISGIVSSINGAYNII